MKKLTLLITILGMIAIASAQIEKKELIITPEMEEMVATKIKDVSEDFYSSYGIKNKEQLDNLHLGKPIPTYEIVNEKLDHVSTWNISRVPDGEPLSLRFTNDWIVPVLSDGEILLFVNSRSIDYVHNPYIGLLRNADMIEHFPNYEHKDLVIGCVSITSSAQGMDHLIIRKDNQDIFVKIYDEITGEYFKNEYSFSELINHMKELDLRAKEARMRYYEKVADKSELNINEIIEMLDSTLFSRLKKGSWRFSSYGIKDSLQLEHLHLGKPIPKYRIENGKLTFIGEWEITVMSDGEPLFFTSIKLEDDGQYREAGGSSGGEMLEAIHNYEYKDLIVGFLGTRRDMDFLFIRRDNQDIFVEIYDHATSEYLKNEYSLSEILFARAQIGKKELNLTPELEERVVREIRNLPEENYSEYGIKNKSQLNNLHIGKPIPRYTLDPAYAMSLTYDGEPLSLKFSERWCVPVWSDETPLLFGTIAFSYHEGSPLKFSVYSKVKNIIEHFHNYEYKDSIMGFVATTFTLQGMDYLMIRKDNQDVFVQVFDEITGEYFTNEYSFSELPNHLKEVRMRYFAQVAHKSELILTPEIRAEMDSTLLSYMKKYPDKGLSYLGIKEKSQLENLYLGKPIPSYMIVNESLTFTGCWQIPVLFDGELLFLTRIKLEVDGQYSLDGYGNTTAEAIRNYEYKDLIIGRLFVRYGQGYLIIRRDNKDIFVQIYDNDTREYFKNEYSLSEIILLPNH